MLRWTNGQIDALNQLYPTAPKLEVIAEIKTAGAERTWRQIVAQASALKIKRLRVREPAIVLNRSEVEKVWLACAIDGEGEIGMQRSKMRRGKGYTFQGFIGLSNTHRGFIDYGYGLCGATSEIQSQKRYENQAPTWRFRVNASSRVRGILEAILAYLIIKRGHAETLLEFYELCDRLNEGKPVYETVHFTPEIEALYQKLRLLNQRGAQRRSTR